MSASFTQGWDFFDLVIRGLGRQLYYPLSHVTLYSYQLAALGLILEQFLWVKVRAASEAFHDLQTSW
jgi:hypothetical protein